MLAWLTVSLLGAAVFVLIILDLVKLIRLTHPAIMTLYLLLAPNVLLAGYLLFSILPFTLPTKILCLTLSGVFTFFMWLRLNVFPVTDGQKTGFRLKALIGGRYITYAAMGGLALNMVLLPVVYSLLWHRVPWQWLLANALFAAGDFCVLFLNGLLRLLCTSKKLRVVGRVLILLGFWVPVANFIFFARACRMAYEEYDYALYKRDLDATRICSQICATKYPLLLVHGVLFRDLRYFNYWGRIPRALIQNGAKVYYGNQEAVGTIEYNGQDIARRIEEILGETGCEKVNIIAHSKGGLDARYAVTCLGMADKVASLTTVCTPHRGCRFVDKACRLPEGLYQFVARQVNRVFRRLGDKNPDFYHATRQFATAASEDFNRNTPDMPQVYYQSYAAKMAKGSSDRLLSIPYHLIRPLEGDNDGLVSVTSAVWGNYRGLLASSTKRGVSHGDMIDLKREDFKGFDVREVYIQMVAELKEMGF